MTMMKRFFLVLLFVMCPVAASADYYTTPFRYEDYETCRDDALGLRFACRSNWSIEFADLTDRFVISEDPFVEMIMVKEPTRLVSIEQLSVDILTGMNRYAQGFQTERIDAGAFKAVKVKAIAANDPESRLTDVYFLRDGALYKIYFNVSPYEAWDVYQFLWEKVVFSLEFL